MVKRTIEIPTISNIKSIENNNKFTHNYYSKRMERTVSIRNISRTIPVIISLSSANFLEVSDKLIPPSTSQTVSVKGGIRELIVQKEYGTSIWKGFIPVKVNDEIIISPEKSTVRYRGLNLPKLAHSKSFTTKTYLYLAILIVMLSLAIGGGIYYVYQ
jgi:hypothetical protein